MKEAEDGIYCGWPPPCGVVLPTGETFLQYTEISCCNMLSTVLAVVLLVVLGRSQANDPATLEASIKFEKNYSLLPACINQCVWDSE